MKTNLAIVGCSFLLLLLAIQLIGIFERSAKNPVSDVPTDQLVAIISEQNSELFSLAMEELNFREDLSKEDALIIAKALGFPRHDSYLAAFVLIKTGPDAEMAIPKLIQMLDNERPEIRAFSSFVLGTIGNASSCAVPLLRLYYETRILLLELAPQMRWN
jgi:HEAT repeat protein